MKKIVFILLLSSCCLFGCLLNACANPKEPDGVVTPPRQEQDEITDDGMQSGESQEENNDGDSNDNGDWVELPEIR